MLCFSFLNQRNVLCQFRYNLIKYCHNLVIFNILYRLTFQRISKSFVNVLCTSLLMLSVILNYCFLFLLIMDPSNPLSLYGHQISSSLFVSISYIVIVVKFAVQIGLTGITSVYTPYTHRAKPRPLFNERCSFANIFVTLQ